VSPLSSGLASVVVTGRATALLYAVVQSVWAWIARASFECVVPDTTPGGNPSIAEPGETPTSPVITLFPVLVMVCPARMAKSWVAPSGTVGSAAMPTEGTASMATSDSVSSNEIERVLLSVFMIPPAYRNVE